jgi:hypothetical protein
MEDEITAYRVRQFCKRYVLSKATFYREVAAKRLIPIKRGRTTLITHAEAERWFETLG